MAIPSLQLAVVPTKTPFLFTELLVVKNKFLTLVYAVATIEGRLRVFCTARDSL